MNRFEKGERVQILGKSALVEIINYEQFLQDVTRSTHGKYDGTGIVSDVDYHDSILVMFEHRHNIYQFKEHDLAKIYQIDESLFVI